MLQSARAHEGRQRDEDPPSVEVLSSDPCISVANILDWQWDPVYIGWGAFLLKHHLVEVKGIHSSAVYNFSMAGSVDNRLVGTIAFLDDPRYNVKAECKRHDYCFCWVTLLQAPESANPMQVLYDNVNSIKQKNNKN